MWFWERVARDIYIYTLRKGPLIAHRRGSLESLTRQVAVLIALVA